MGQEAFNGIGDCYAVNQQNRVDSEEVEQGNQFTCANAEVFFYNFGDVFTRIFTGQHKASQTAVCKEGHWEGKDRHDDQRDHTAYACVDRQEQYTRANRRAVKAQHPHGVCLAPCAAGLARNDSAGLSVFHLFLLEEA